MISAPNTLARIEAMPNVMYHASGGLGASLTRQISSVTVVKLS
jgi:hypothetical protein